MYLADSSRDGELFGDPPPLIVTSALANDTPGTFSTHSSDELCVEKSIPLVALLVFYLCVKFDCIILGR